MFHKWYGWVLCLMLAPATVQAANQSLGVFAKDDPKFMGALVTNVVPGFARDQMGIQVGDLIIGVNNDPVNTAADLPKLIQAAPSHVTLTVVRGSQPAFTTTGDLTQGVLPARISGEKGMHYSHAKNAHKGKATMTRRPKKPH